MLLQKIADNTSRDNNFKAEKL